MFIYDKAGNVTELYSSDARFTEESHFELSGTTTADVTKPTLESITVDKKSVKVGDSVEVTIKAKDEGSGINWIYLSYSAPQTGNEKKINVWYDYEAEVYRGRFK